MQGIAKKTSRASLLRCTAIREQDPVKAVDKEREDKCPRAEHKHPALKAHDSTSIFLRLKAMRTIMLMAINSVTR